MLFNPTNYLHKNEFYLFGLSDSNPKLFEFNMYWSDSNPNFFGREDIRYGHFSN